MQFSLRLQLGFTRQRHGGTLIGKLIRSVCQYCNRHGDVGALAADAPHNGELLVWHACPTLGSGDSLRSPSWAQIGQHGVDWSVHAASSCRTSNDL
jgi:hypothetical protein